ncbi:hypothetical protein [Natronococcus wangiae]|uniref:hypothetical protein n=1 Tax=Natronococcus wangiae TaxID=3068275 RepID=UPI00273F042A|nr:hypothetical protein [Natronococcus sp. AD5]
MQLLPDFTGPRDVLLGLVGVRSGRIYAYQVGRFQRAVRRFGRPDSIHRTIEIPDRRQRFRGESILGDSNECIDDIGIRSVEIE